MQTPCIKVCRLEGSMCVGCGRTREEIGLWTRMTDQERDAIMRRVAPRVEGMNDPAQLRPAQLGIM